MTPQSLRRQRRKDKTARRKHRQGRVIREELQNNQVEKSVVKTTVDASTNRIVAVASKKFTTSMKVGTTSDHMPCEKRIGRMVKPKQWVHTRVPERGRLSKELRPTSSRVIRTQQELVVEHMQHAEFKANHYQHPVKRTDGTVQVFRRRYTGKKGVQCEELAWKPKLKYSKIGAVHIDRVGSSKSTSMNLEVGSIYLKTDQCTGKRTMVNQKKAVVTRDEKQAQRLAHAASKRARRARKSLRVSRKLAAARYQPG